MEFKKKFFTRETHPVGGLSSKEKELVRLVKPKIGFRNQNRKVRQLSFPGFGHLLKTDQGNTIKTQSRRLDSTIQFKEGSPLIRNSFPGLKLPPIGRNNQGAVFELPASFFVSRPGPVSVAVIVRQPEKWPSKQFLIIAETQKRWNQDYRYCETFIAKRWPGVRLSVS